MCGLLTTSTLGSRADVGAGVSLALPPFGRGLDVGRAPAPPMASRISHWISQSGKRGADREGEREGESATGNGPFELQRVSASSY